MVDAQREVETLADPEGVAEADERGLAWRQVDFGSGAEGKATLFMSADKVKFRKPVRPGDQLTINAKILKVRGEKLAAAECNCTVAGQVVSSAELMFALMEDGED